MDTAPDMVVVFDAAKVAAESEFWAGLLGGTVAAEDDFHMVSVDGAPQMACRLLGGVWGTRQRSR